MDSMYDCIGAEEFPNFQMLSITVFAETIIFVSKLFKNGTLMQLQQTDVNEITPICPTY